MGKAEKGIQMEFIINPQTEAFEIREFGWSLSPRPKKVSTEAEVKEARLKFEPEHKYFQLRAPLKSRRIHKVKTK